MAGAADEPRWKINELIGGCAAGLVQDGLLHPVDTMRARLDMHARAPPDGGPAAALLSEFSRVRAADGVRGLYRGYSFCLITSAPCNALYFGAYSTMRRNFGGSTPLHDAAAGFAAETVASVLWTPVDVVKQRLQVGPLGQPTATAVRTACADAGGLSGLWRGYFAGLMVWGPFSSVYFMSYEALLRQLVGPRDAQEAHAGDNLACGIGAGTVAALTTQPLDCAKTRIQVGAVAQDAHLLPTVQAIWRTEGARALWRGAAARALWLAPGCGITITVFERVAKAFEGRV